MKHGRSGFTLIELMVVVIIIAALAGMVMPYLLERPDRMKAEIARGDIATILGQLRLYRLDNGKFPTTDEGLQALLRAPSSARKWGGPYLEEPPEDPWGKSYEYRYPGSKNKLLPDVWSAGLDGESGSQDDVWPEEAKE